MEKGEQKHAHIMKDHIMEEVSPPRERGIPSRQEDGHDAGERARLTGTDGNSQDHTVMRKVAEHAHIMKDHIMEEVPRQRERGIPSRQEDGHDAGERAPLTGTQDHVVMIFQHEMQRLPPLSSQCCIYRVPEKLRKVSVESYKPRIVSIGPFHYKDQDLDAMIEYKIRYMQSFLRHNKIILANYVENVRTWEQRIRNCYAEHIELSSDELVAVILMDGCFIVELLLRYRFPRYIDETDRIFRKPRIIGDVLHDLMLLENQLPFFVLEWLFHQVRNNYPGNPLSIVDLVHYFLKHLVKLDECPTDSIIEHGVDHMVDFARRCYLPKSQSELTKVENLNEIPPSVTELDEAGVQFAKRTSTSSLLDVRFTHGCLEIPHFQVDDFTETIFRNLIAFEQCHDVDKYIIQFVFLMDCFINTAKDVELLTQNGVISCVLGNSEDVSKLFNSLCKEVSLGQTSYYFDLCKNINAYCKTPWHKWKATLKRDYFKTPWAIASTIAAVVLLILTLIQTVCSILQVI